MRLELSQNFATLKIPDADLIGVRAGDDVSTLIFRGWLPAFLLLLYFHGDMILMPVRRLIPLLAFLLAALLTPSMSFQLINHDPNRILDVHVSLICLQDL